MKWVSDYFLWLNDSIKGFFYLCFVVIGLIVLCSAVIAGIGLMLEYFDVN